MFFGITIQPFSVFSFLTPFSSNLNAPIARRNPLAVPGASLLMSKSVPGSMPSSLSFSTIAPSAEAGGLSFISPARPANQEAPCAGSGRALADRSEDVAPQVEKRDDIVAPIRVRHRKDKRLFVEIGPSHSEQRVEARPRDRSERSVGVVRHDGELV